MLQEATRRCAACGSKPGRTHARIFLQHAISSHVAQQIEQVSSFGASAGKFACDVTRRTFYAHATGPPVSPILSLSFYARSPTSKLPDVHLCMHPDLLCALSTPENHCRDSMLQQNPCVCPARLGPARRACSVSAHKRCAVPAPIMDEVGKCAQKRSPIMDRKKKRSPIMDRKKKPGGLE